MPRSSKAPEPPPEPDVNELVQNDVARIKRLLGLDVNRLALGSEVEGIVTGMFGPADYTITGVNTIEFVNVSTSLGPAQGSSGFPAQVTGLTVTPQAGTDTQLNLTWTATTVPAEFNYYNVYRGPTGFTVGPSFIISQPVTNSYNNTGLTSGTTYYYRVSITNDAGLEGPASSQVSGTTTGTAPGSIANLWLKFDGNYTDSSSFANTVNSSNSSGFAGSGQFGTNSVALNTPTAGLDYVAIPNNTNTALDFTNGFSYSFWIYPQSTNASQYLFSKQNNSSNFVGFYYAGSLNYIGVDIKEAGTYNGVKTTGTITQNAWSHVVVTYDGAASKIYLNKVLNTTTGSQGFLPTVTTDLIIGNLAGDSTGNQTFRGRIDEFQYFKGLVLTQTQVNNLFSTNAP